MLTDQQKKRRRSSTTTSNRVPNYYRQLWTRYSILNALQVACNRQPLHNANSINSLRPSIHPSTSKAAAHRRQPINITSCTDLHSRAVSTCDYSGPLAIHIHLSIHPPASNGTGAFYTIFPQVINHGPCNYFNPSKKQQQQPTANHGNSADLLSSLSAGTHMWKQANTYTKSSTFWLCLSTCAPIDLKHVPRRRRW